MDKKLKQNIPDGNKDAFDVMLRVMVPPAEAQEAEETLVTFDRLQLVRAEAPGNAALHR